MTVGLSPVTVNTGLEGLRRFSKGEGLIDSNPFDSVIADEEPKTDIVSFFVCADPRPQLKKDGFQRLLLLPRT